MSTILSPSDKPCVILLTVNIVPASPILLAVVEIVPVTHSHSPATHILLKLFIT